MKTLGSFLSLIERRLELPRVAIDGVLVHDGVVHHDGQAVDEARLGNVFCLEETWTVGARLRLHGGGLHRRDRECGQRNGAKQVTSRQHDFHGRHSPELDARFCDCFTCAWPQGDTPHSGISSTRTPATPAPRQSRLIDRNCHEREVDWHCALPSKRNAIGPHLWKQRASEMHSCVVRPRFRFA